MSVPTFVSGFGNTDYESPSTTIMTTAKDSDWEYEYDENETEDYYFTLDITTHQTASFLKEYLSARKAQRSTSNGRKDSTRSGELTSRTTNAQATPSDNGTPQPSSIASPRPDRRLQALDLHTDNPLIMFDHQLYSCHWATDLGTSFNVARPGVAEEPLRPGRVLDVVGISQARLVGKPAIVTPRKDNSAKEIGASAEYAISIDEDDDVDIVAETPEDTSSQRLSTTERFAGAHEQVKDHEARAKASFLEQLSAIKLKKGETDSIPFFGVKNYEVPSNKDQIRANALAEDSEREKNARLPTGKNRKCGPRGPRKSRNSSTSHTTVAGHENERKKPGPKSNIAIRSSLGLS